MIAGVYFRTAIPREGLRTALSASRLGLILAGALASSLCLNLPAHAVKHFMGGNIQDHKDSQRCVEQRNGLHAETMMGCSGGGE